MNRGSPAIHPFANESFVHLPLTVALALARPESLPTSPEVIRFENDEITGRLGEFRERCWEDGGHLWELFNSLSAERNHGPNTKQTRF